MGPERASMGWGSGAADATADEPSDWPIVSRQTEGRGITACGPRTAYGIRTSHRGGASLADRAVVRSAHVEGLTAPTLRQYSRVTGDEEANTLRFVVTANMRPVAEHLADTYAAEYVLYASPTTVTRRLRQEMGRAIRASREFEPPAVRRQRKEQLAFIEGSYARWAQKAAPPMVLDKSSVSPVRQHGTRNGFLGGTLGLLLGLGLGFIAASQDRLGAQAPHRLR